MLMGCISDRHNGAFSDFREFALMSHIRTLPPSAFSSSSDIPSPFYNTSLSFSKYLALLRNRTVAHYRMVYRVTKKKKKKKKQKHKYYKRKKKRERKRRRITQPYALFFYFSL